jgi:hypothetical protein
MRRRFVIVTFNRSFTEDPTRDVLIADKIINAELPGIARRVLTAACKVLGGSDYSLPPCHHLMIEKWLGAGAGPGAGPVDREDPESTPADAAETVQTFLHEADISPGEVAAGQLYTKYKVWAEAKQEASKLIAVNVMTHIAFGCAAKEVLPFKKKGGIVYYTVR